MDASKPDVINELTSAIASFCLQINSRLANFSQQTPKHVPRNELTCMVDVLLEYRNSLLREKRKLSDKKIKIAFAGSFSSGKSSVINKFLESDRLPVSILAETGVPCKLEKAPNTRAEVWTKAGTVKESIDNFTKKDLERLIALSEHPEKIKEIQDIDFVHLYIKTEALSDNIVLIDLPGIGDDYAANRLSEQRASDAASAADILIWVNSSQNPISIIEENFFNAHINGKYPTAIIFLYNVWVEGELSEEEWDRIFNEDFFDNETRIRQFFEQHSKVLYQNQLHKFAAAGINRIENDTHFTRFSKELNKLTTPDRLWIRSYRMKKLSIQCQILNDQLSILITEWEEKKAARIKELKEAVANVTKGIKQKINDNFDVAVNALTASKTQRMTEFNYYIHKDKLTGNLAYDARIITKQMDQLRFDIFSTIETTLFPYMKQDWLTEKYIHEGFLGLYSSPATPDTIFAVTKNVVDLDAVADNVVKGIGFLGKKIADVWNGTNEASDPDYDKLEKLDYTASSEGTLINLSHGYQKIINSLNHAKSDRFTKIKAEWLDNFCDLILADYDTILLQLKSMRTTLENILSLAVKYSEVKQL